MSTFRVGQRQGMMIANVGDMQKEKELQRFDANRDGVINATEAARYYSDKTLGERPTSFDDVFKLAGGRQHEIKTFHQEYTYLMGAGVYDWKGDFNLPGMGAGNVRTGRSKPFYYSYHSNTDGGGRQVDAYKFLVDCNLMDQSFIENHVQSATLIIGPRGFDHEAGSDMGEAVAVPLDIATQDGYQSYSRGGGGGWVPEKKYLAASVDTGDLRKLAGDSGGLSFYIRLETDKGTKFINRDGKSFNNFDVDAAELRPDNA